jgi:hypothetical protein
MNELFPNFINDAAIYNAAENYWKNAFDNVACQVADKWIDWFKNTYLNGTPIQNGNPILSKVCLNRHRGLLVIQVPYDEDEAEITAYTDTYEADCNPILHLTIHCVLTKKTSAIANILITEWVQNNKSKHDIEALIDDLNPIRRNL